jgi:hypothetical protein
MPLTTVSTAVITVLHSAEVVLVTVSTAVITVLHSAEVVLVTHEL